MTMTTWLLGTLIQTACSLAVVLPVILIAAWTSRPRRLRPRSLLGLALFFFVGLALTRLGTIWTFIKSPWQAMTLEAAWALLVILATRSTAAGLTARIPARAWRDSLRVTGLLLLFVAARRLLIRALGGGGPVAVPFEYLLYQATMPGLAEELSYRGLIQPALNADLSRPWRLLRARVGWGWIITSLLFWAPHAFRVDAHLHLTFYWPTLTMQLIVAFALGWMRERTASLLPPIIAHNLVNLTWTLI